MRGDIRGIGYILEQCKSLRVTADYRLNETIGLKAVEESIRCAERIIEKVGDIS